MSTVHSPRPTSSHVEVRQTEPRATPPPATRRFRDALGSSAGALLGGVEAAASLVPGASAVTAAVRGGSAGVGGASGAGGGQRPEGPGAPGGDGSAEGSSVEDALRASQDQNLYYLQLQEQMSAENRRYTALSNVLKARHETAKNAIGNIR